MGYDVHLIQPSPDIFGRTPVARVLSEMAIFTQHSIRSTLSLGHHFIVLSPAIWIAAFLGVMRKALRSAGLSGRWLDDKPRPYSVATPWTKLDLAFVRRRLPADCAVIISDYIFCVPAFECAHSDVGKAIVMHDLFHTREGGGKDSVASVTRKDEVRLLGAADVVLAIQDEERRFVEANVPGTKALLVPMPADLSACPQPGLDDTVLFVGSNTAPNSVGLKWFLAEVWPMVLRARPNRTLLVAGTVNRAFEDNCDKSVHFLGMVPDLAPLYRDAGVVISPLTFGSGLKIKLVEALAAGKAVVATSTTLQGVREQCEASVICTDDAGEFAEALIRLSIERDTREALAASALACAERNFSASMVHRELRDWLEDQR